MPLSNPTLIVIPDLAEITEGDNLYLICSVEGTPPVTFKWYRSDNENPVHAITVYSNNTDYHIPLLSRTHSGRYHCEADNPAINIVYSDFVDIQGEQTTTFSIFRGRYYISTVYYYLFIFLFIISFDQKYSKSH